MIFTDEMRFNLHGGRLEGGYMYWGAVSATGPVALVRVDGNEDSEKYTEIILDRLVPYLDKYGYDKELLQDGLTSRSGIQIADKRHLVSGGNSSFVVLSQTNYNETA
ncbi:hypothetical protein RvY_04466 [Ramazzottius varieornatus]|uniref:Uncharacterized protein n=1 Tax=Ramazzottius varieornatus TaxID=947166 RepID=A0A1D1UV36_RAMVA|nr:hypothetical protein RvY_04466 [Ramazzottius varieornatus]